MFVLLYILLIFPFGNHALYVSTCEIVIEDDRSWYGSVRIFHDDLEDALQNATGSRPNLTAELIHIRRKDIDSYLNEHLFFEKGHVRLPFSTAQMSRTEDIIEIGIRGTQPWPSGDMTVHNDLLIEIFQSQKNIITIRNNGLLQTFYLNKNSTFERI